MKTLLLFNGEASSSTLVEILAIHHKKKKKKNLKLWIKNIKIKRLTKEKMQEEKSSLGAWTAKQGLRPTPALSLPKRKETMYTAGQGLPKTKEKNNKETKCKMAPLTFTFRNSCCICKSSFYAASCLFSATLSHDSPHFN